MHFFIALSISISLSQVYSQGVNKASSGLEAVDGFFKTTMANYSLDSKEMISYILPSYMANITANKINIYKKIWKFNIEKQQGNFYYVAVHTSPDNKLACKLMSFQTQKENGKWYLVPGNQGTFSNNFVNPYFQSSKEHYYVPKSGPYYQDGRVFNDVQIDSKTVIMSHLINIEAFINKNKYTILEKKTISNKADYKKNINFFYGSANLRGYETVMCIVIYDAKKNYNSSKPTLSLESRTKNSPLIKEKVHNKKGEGISAFINRLTTGVNFKNYDGYITININNLLKGTYYILAK